MSRNSKTDREYIKLAKALETTIAFDLDELSDDLRELVVKNSNSQGVQDEDAINKGVVLLIAAYFLLYRKNLTSTNGRVAEVKADYELANTVTRLNRAGMYDEARTLRVQLNNARKDTQSRLMARRWNPKAPTLDRVLKTVQEGSTKTVLNIVHIGVEEGKSAFNIAKDIEAYVKPTAKGLKVTPYDVYRKRFGRPKSYVPKNMPIGSVNYNSILIARTETARTYREASFNYYKDKSYVKWWNWVLSNSHPAIDVCDDYASETYPDPGAVPDSHPNCMCDIQPEIMTVEEMREL